MTWSLNWRDFGSLSCYMLALICSESCKGQSFCLKSQLEAAIRTDLKPTHNFNNKIVIQIRAWLSFKKKHHPLSFDSALSEDHKAWITQRTKHFFILCIICTEINHLLKHRAHLTSPCRNPSSSLNSWLPHQSTGTIMTNYSSLTDFR